MTGATLLRAAADHLAADTSPYELDEVSVAALVGLLRRCAEAAPIDFAEPPRNPRDIAVVNAALAFAQELLSSPSAEPVEATNVS